MKLNLTKISLILSILGISIIMFGCGRGGNVGGQLVVPDEDIALPVVSGADTQADLDGDGIFGDADNCPEVENYDQMDIDSDGAGDVCDEDMDGDEILNGADNCPIDFNNNQGDLDGDGIGDLCDDTFNDQDQDTIGDGLDNCVS
ncbi:MAG: hypothetical protein COS89_00785, partial [Deltaproteobacteria bacterium CG07_land_8_20_14_0_80_38_7]